MKQLIPFTFILALLVGCESSPKRIDPQSDDALTTMGVDFNEIVEWSETLTRRMLDAGFLDRGYNLPVVMVVSDIENRSDLSQFPRESMLGRIRSTMLQTGKVIFTSAYGRDATDTMTRDTQDLARDPLFDTSQVPAPGQASVARLSLRTQILWHHASQGRARQNTYEVRMFVTDVVNGQVVWEGFSDPIAKARSRGGIGF
jgi:hypothetical protein